MITMYPHGKTEKSVLNYLKNYLEKNKGEQIFEDTTGMSSMGPFENDLIYHYLDNSLIISYKDFSGNNKIENLQIKACGRNSKKVVNDLVKIINEKEKK